MCGGRYFERGIIEYRRCEVGDGKIRQDLQFEKGEGSEYGMRRDGANNTKIFGKDSGNRVLFIWETYGNFNRQANIEGGKIS